MSLPLAQAQTCPSWILRSSAVVFVVLTKSAISEMTIVLFIFQHQCMPKFSLPLKFSSGLREPLV